MEDGGWMMEHVILFFFSFHPSPAFGWLGLPVVWACVCVCVWEDMHHDDI